MFRPFKIPSKAIRCTSSEHNPNTIALTRGIPPHYVTDRLVTISKVPQSVTQTVLRTQRKWRAKFDSEPKSDKNFMNWISSSDAETAERWQSEDLSKLVRICEDNGFKYRILEESDDIPEQNLRSYADNFAWKPPKKGLFEQTEPEVNTPTEDIQIIQLQLYFQFGRFASVLVRTVEK